MGSQQLEAKIKHFIDEDSIEVMMQTLPHDDSKLNIKQQVRKLHVYKGYRNKT